MLFIRQKYEWIFFIDADERCTPELGKEIKDAIKKGEKYAYWIKRRINSVTIKQLHGTTAPGLCLPLNAKQKDLMLKALYIRQL